MSTWIAVVAVGLGSYVFRVGPLLLFERWRPSAAADTMIRRAGLAAITALVVGSVRNHVVAGDAVPALAAVTVATVLAVRGRSMLQLVGAGAATYAVISVLIALAH